MASPSFLGGPTMTDEKRNPPRAASEPLPEDPTPTAPMQAANAVAGSASSPEAKPQRRTERERAVTRGLEKLGCEEGRAFKSGRVIYTFVRALAERSNGEQVLLYQRHLECPSRSSSRVRSRTPCTTPTRSRTASRAASPWASSTAT